MSLVGVALGVTMPLLSIIMEREGVSATINGANTAMAGLAILCVTPFTTRLVLRFGVARLLLTCIVVSALTLLGFMLTPPPWYWFPLRFISGCAIGLLFVVGEFWINALADERRRGLVMGIYGTVLAVGFGAGPLLLTLVGTQGPAPFLATIAIFALAALPVAAARGAAPRMDKAASAPFLSFLVVAPAATLAALVFGAIETSSFGLLPVYGLRLGFSAAEAAGLLVAMAAGSVLFQVPLGMLSDRMDRRLLLFACALLAGLCAALLPLLGASVIGAYILLFCFGAIVGGLYPVGLAHLGSRFRGADLAAANGAFVMLYSVGMLAGPAAAGAGLDLWPPHGFALTLALFLALFCLVVAWRHISGKREHPAARA